MDFNIKLIFFVIFCITYVEANDELVRLTDQAKALIEKFNTEYEEKKQKYPNVDYLSEVYKKLGSLLNNNNLQTISITNGTNGELNNVMEEIKLLRLELQLLKVELASLKNENRKGEKGDIGRQGSPGEKGTRGEKGERGEIGFSGKQGIPGRPGPIGPIGLKGIKGTKGEYGEKGDMGMKGEPGENIFTPIIQSKNQTKHN